jgi:hypothetical protein
VDTAELELLMERFDLLDGALLLHGYKPYMRDYELIVENHVGPAEQGTYLYLFKFCVEANICTSLTDDIYKKSLDERLICYETGADLDGYVWGVNWSGLYPGWRLLAESAKAKSWQERIGRDFHEVLVEGNAYNIGLIFSELTVEKISNKISPGIKATSFPLG